MSLSNSQKNVLISSAANLCIKLFNALFSALKDDFKTDSLLEIKCLALADCFIGMAAATMQYSDEEYEKYVKTAVYELNYDPADIENTTIYKYAINLRKLFRASPDFLKSSEVKFNQEVSGNFPSPREIKALLGRKFDILANIFRKEYEKGERTTGVYQFIIDNINKIIKP